MKEIGSEYWAIELETSNNNLDFLNIGKDYKLLMSGRTAIDYVINDINDSKKIVYMPNYCCESMVQPFIDNGYTVEFYNVDVLNNVYDINIDFDCSIFFAMSYFGFSISNMDKYINILSKKGIVIIEDITHRFLCDINHSNKADYLICSLRKWFPIISGGIAINMKNVFKNDIGNYIINDNYVETKKTAMNLKRKYIEDSIEINKNEFLELYYMSNEMIKDYKNQKIDIISLNILRHIDINSIKKYRINNYKIILKKLKKNKKIKLLYNYQKGDCPLFVPIIIDNRDNIRKQLIDHSIYLPIHWPNFNKFNNEIYNHELSLICDQRYSINDIEKYIDELIKIVGD